MSEYLDDYVYFYPNQDDPSLQRELARRKEFADLASTTQDTSPMPGSTLFKHQEFIKRFFAVYDRLLLIHRTGTGKSCAAFGASEAFKVALIKELGAADLYFTPERTHVRRVYVLSRGKTVIEELRYQLLCRCTRAEEYFTPKVQEAETLHKAQVRLNKEIGRFYSIDSFTTFTNDAREVVTRENSYQKYEYSMFIVDEAHLLTAPTVESEPESESEPEAEAEFAPKKEREVRESYNFLHELFHRLKHVKILLMTATPMINSAQEIVPLINLLLPLERQMPENVDFGASFEALEPYFRGLVSFVREVRPQVEVVIKGSPIETEDLEVFGRKYAPQARVFALEMSRFQTEAYLRQSESNFSIQRRQASNFVFPDGSVGIGAFDKHMTRVSADHYTFRNPNMEEEVRNNLATYSVKFFHIVKFCKEQEGNCFVYSEFLKGGGALLLGKVFQMNGFKQFFGEKQVVVPKKRTGDYYQRICKTSERDVDVAQGFEKELRFALVTSETPRDNKRHIFDLFNSEANRHGEYLKVIVGSKVSRTGINLYNVLQIHLLSQAWNRSNMYQAESRGLRANSHDALLRERARVSVAIYPYTVLLNSGVAKTLGLNPAETIDNIIALESERKDIVIHRVERVMKRAAVDCIVHRKRNVLESDRPGSPENDYEQAPFKCEWPAPEPGDVDLRSYYALYASDDVRAAQTELEARMRDAHVLSVRELGAERVFEEALYALRQELKRRQSRYGMSVYWMEDGNYVYCDPLFPLWSAPDAMMSYYADNLIFQENSQFEDYVRQMQMRDEAQAVKKLSSLSDEEQIESVLKTLSYATKVDMFERAVLARARGEALAKYQALVYEKYKFALYEFVEPVEYLKKKREEMEQKRIRPGPGRKRVKHVVKAQRERVPVPAEGPRVFVHVLYGQEPGKTLYAAVTRALKGTAFRILRPDEGAWRDMGEHEIVVYDALIQEQNLKRYEELQAQPIYGLLSRIDGKFRIVDRREEKEKPMDARRARRGKVCENWKKPELIELFRTLGIAHSEELESKPRKWFCDEIKKYLEEKNLLIEL